MQKLTIVILTKNEAANIGRLLDSLEGVDHPIFVVDSGSTDRTLDILRDRGVHYVHHDWTNYSGQRNWAQNNLPEPSEWVLHLDAGERLTEGMRDWLAAKNFTEDVAGVDGYMFARRAIFMGSWMKYGGYHPIYHLRLYRMGYGRCEAKAYDQHFVAKGKIIEAPKGADLEDGVMASLKSFTEAHARWAVYEAVESILAEEAPGEVDAKFFGTAIQHRRWWKENVFQRTPLFLRSFLYLFYRYFFKLGFLDGTKGLVFHFLQGFWFRFLIDAVIYEIRQEVKEGRPLPTIVRDKYGLDVDVILNRQGNDNEEPPTIISQLPAPQEAAPNYAISGS
ncbi:MAG: glycosyltransferase family 2 protein [Bacteroidota bacterium]